MSAESVVQALSELFSAYGADGNDRRAAKDVGEKLVKRKDVKEAFAPLARCFKYGVPIERILQLCIDQPYSHPLHRAAAALLSRGELALQPMVAKKSDAQPKRWTTRLMPSLCAPVVYTTEDKPLVAVWSVDTGAHLLDLKVPAGKGSYIAVLVERPDGTLRAVTTCGLVSERAPSAATFVKRYDVGTTRNGWLASSDLRYHVQQPEFQPEHTPEGHFQTLWVHDIETGKKTALRFPGSYLCNRFFLVNETTIAVGGYLNTEVSEEQWRAEPFVLLVDLLKQTFVQHKLPRTTHEVWMLFPASRPGHVGVEMTIPGSEDPNERVELELATGTLSPASPAVEVAHDPSVRFSGGRLTYDPRSHTITDQSGRVVGGYVLAGEPYSTLAAYDALRDRLIVAGADPATPVYVLVPYDAAAAEAEEAAPKTTGAPFVWAQKGTRLRYDIADYDAADEWQFEVVEAGAELVLKIDMGSDKVAAAARFSAAALDGATQFVVLSQGGADIELDAPVTSRVPPIVLSRAMAKKLAAKKTLTYKSEWTGEVRLENAAPGKGTVRVNGTEQPVATLSASSEDGATLVAVADAEWPLILERVEDDCHIKLVEIDRKNVDEKTAPPPAADAKPKPAAMSAATAATAGAQRFELVEGGSAKFWEIAQSGAQLTVRFGKLGAAGQTQVKDLGSEAAAQREAEKLIREKTKKGYAPV